MQQCEVAECFCMSVSKSREEREEEKERGERMEEKEREGERRREKREKERSPPGFHSNIQMASSINAIDRTPGSSCSPFIQPQGRLTQALKGPR